MLSSQKPHRYFGEKPDVHLQRISGTKVLHFSGFKFSICLDHIKVRAIMYDSGKEYLHTGMKFILDDEIIAEYMNDSGILHVMPITRYTRGRRVIEHSVVKETRVKEKIWGPDDTYNVVETQIFGFKKGDEVQVVVRKLKENS